MTIAHNFFLSRSSSVLIVYVLEKLHNCMFFDKDIQTSIFFPTLHDAMLHVIDKHMVEQRNDGVVRKTYTHITDRIMYWTEAHSVSPTNNYIVVTIQCFCNLLKCFDFAVLFFLQLNDTKL